MAIWQRRTLADSPAGRVCVSHSGGNQADCYPARPTGDGRSWRTASHLLPAGCLIAAIYWPTLVELAAVWEIDPNYSHGYLVAPLSLFFAWRTWKLGARPVAEQVAWRDQALGLALLGVGLGLHALAWFLGHLLYDVLSLTCVLLGTLCCMGGLPAVRGYGFAVAFLVFMAPLPMSWHEKLAVPMQRLASDTSALLLHVGGVPVFREGYLLHLPGYRAEVGAACSGLRQITSFVLLSTAAAYLAKLSAASRVMLVAASFPIAILSNTFRIVLTGVVAVYLGPRWAEGVFHTLEGTAVAAVGLVLIYATYRLLSAMENRSLTAAAVAPPQV